MSSGRSGSSIQYGDGAPPTRTPARSSGPVGRFQSPWSSTIMSHPARRQRLAHLAERLESLVELGRRVVHAPPRRTRTRRTATSSCCGHALRERLWASSPARPVEEGVEVLGGALAARRRRQAPVLEHLALVGPDVPVSRAGCCRPCGSPGGWRPEELDHRLAGRLAGQDSTAAMSTAELPRFGAGAAGADVGCGRATRRPSIAEGSLRPRRTAAGRLVQRYAATSWALKKFPRASAGRRRMWKAHEAEVRGTRRAGWSLASRDAHGNGSLLS